MTDDIETGEKEWKKPETDEIGKKKKNTKQWKREGKREKPRQRKEETPERTLERGNTPQEWEKETPVKNVRNTPRNSGGKMKKGNTQRKEKRKHTERDENGMVKFETPEKESG